MKRSTLQMGTASLMLFGAVAVAQGQRTPYDSKELARLSLEIAVQVKKQLAVAGGPDCTVDTSSSTVCTIAMSTVLIKDPNGDTTKDRPYCLAVAPTVKVKRKQGIPQYIDWRLDPQVLDKGALAFHESSGIAITYEVSPTQIENSHRGRGRGGGGPTLQHLFHVRTHSNARDGEAGYLPVVMWDRLGDGNLELCAAVDPKIVNAE
jgi:hypothetical protein